MATTKSVNWQTKVSPELDEKVTAAAESMGIGRQELVRFVIAQFVDNHLKAQGYIQASIDSVLKQQIAEIPQEKRQ